MTPPAAGGARRVLAARRTFAAVTAANAQSALRFDRRRGGRDTDMRAASSASFFAFVVDVADGVVENQSADEIGDRIIRSRRRATLTAPAAAPRRGAVLVTAHMGSFEVGLAALRHVEANVHVVFKRDAFGGFESLRSALRARLGVQRGCDRRQLVDAATTPRRARGRRGRRDAGRSRGRRSARRKSVPFRIRPSSRFRSGRRPSRGSSAARSCRCSRCGSRDGRFVVHLLAPILVDVNAPSVDGIDPAVGAIAAAIESFVAAAPGTVACFGARPSSKIARVSVPTPSER